jgi:hypothetical protein
VLASNIQPHRYIASLFPEQVTLFPLDEPDALVNALNRVEQRSPAGPVQPCSISLEKISGQRMSRLYQDVYDRVLAHSRALRN